jgi:RNA-binding protein
LLQFSFNIVSIMKTLTPADRKRLKARAHLLSPVVILGSGGLSVAVLKEIDTSLKAHELIKIRVTEDDRQARIGLLGEICSRTGAIAVQHIGKILIVYRENSEPAAPAAKTRPARKQARRPKRSYQGT